MNAAAAPAPTVVVVGSGVVGRRVLKRLDLVSPGVRTLEVDTRRHDLADTSLLDGAAVVVLAHPGPHLRDVAKLLERGVPVVSLADQFDDVQALMSLDATAERAGVSLVVGSGMSPGLAALLARHLADQLARVDEIHVALHGTAGPACARQHHRALAGGAVSIDGGVPVTHRAGTGSALAYFPEPVGPYDCYRAELPVPLVIARCFPDVDRVTARMSANRRDRFTSWLPMLTPPHAEGGVGAVRIEVRGATSSGARDTLIAGIAELVGTAASAITTAFVDLILRGELAPGVVLPGSADLDTRGVLATIERLGVRLQEFTGVPSA